VKWDVFFSNLTYNITKAEGMVGWLRSHAKQTKEREKKKLFAFYFQIFSSPCLLLSESSVGA
jgi:hypothetical protein